VKLFTTQKSINATSYFIGGELLSVTNFTHTLIFLTRMSTLQFCQDLWYQKARVSTRLITEHFAWWSVQSR